MNTNKTGAYIRQKRSKLGLTQKELANRINCTDKAISRWETGRGFPDVSILELLSKELGVTVNELMLGEDISHEEYKRKSDEIIVSIIKASKKKINLLLMIVIILFDIFFSLGEYAPTLRGIFWFSVIYFIEAFNVKKDCHISNIVLLIYQFVLMLAGISSYIIFFYESNFAVIRIFLDDLIVTNITDSFFLNALLVQPFTISLMLITIATILKRNQLEKNHKAGNSSLSQNDKP